MQTFERPSQGDPAVLLLIAIIDRAKVDAQAQRRDAVEFVEMLKALPKPSSIRVK